MIQNWQRAKREISFVLIPLFRQGDVDETPWRCYGRIRHLGNVFFFSGNPENHLDGDVQYVGSVAHTYMRLYFSK